MCKAIDNWFLLTGTVYLHFSLWNTYSELTSYHCFPILSAFPRFRVLIIFSHSFHHSFSCSKQLPCPKISTVPSTLKRTFIFWKLTSNMSPQSLESILYEVFYIIYIKRHFWCSWILVWGFLLSCSSQKLVLIMVRINNDFKRLFSIFSLLFTTILCSYIFLPINVTSREILHKNVLLKKSKQG